MGTLIIGDGIYIMVTNIEGWGKCLQDNTTTKQT